MNWKTDYRSFYYATAPVPEDLQLPAAQTAMLSIDVQNTYLKVRDDPVERSRWAPFQRRMRDTVIPAFLSSRARYIAVASPSRFGFVHKITSSISSSPNRTRSSLIRS